MTNLIENFRGGRYRRFTRNYNNYGEYKYDMKEHQMKINKDIYYFKKSFKKDLNIISNLKNKEEKVKEAYEKLSTKGKNDFNFLNDQAKKITALNIESYIKNKTKIIKTFKVNDYKKKLNKYNNFELAQKEFPLFNEIDNISDDVKQKLNSKLKDEKIKKILNIHKTLNSSLFNSDRTEFYLRITKDSQKNNNFEKFKNLINMFNKNKSLLNLEKPNIPNDIEMSESNFNIFSKIELRLTKTFLVAYLSMFILNIGFLPDEDSEKFSNTIEFFTDINIGDLEEELDDLKYLSKLVVNKNNIIKMIFDFISNNNFETDNVVNFEKIVYDKLELISDEVYEQVIYEFGLPNNIFEASDIQLALLGELNTFTNFKKVNDFETILFMREYYLLLDSNQKTKFLKISDNNKLRLINNWVNGNKLENLKLERKKSTTIAKQKIKKIVDNKIKEIKKKEKSFFQKHLILIIIFNVVILTILGIFYFRFGKKKNNEFTF